MRSLLDVNVLLALFDSGHLHHPRAMAWWSDNAEPGWASCPLTENGYLRIVSQKSYMRPVRLADALSTLRRQFSEGGHEFWPDDLSLLDPRAVDYRYLLGPKQIKAVYLLALSVKHGGRLVTFDRGISTAAARGATPESLIVP